MDRCAARVHNIIHKLAALSSSSSEEEAEEEPQPPAAPKPKQPARQTRNPYTLEEDQQMRKWFSYHIAAGDKALTLSECRSFLANHANPEGCTPKNIQDHLMKEH